MPPRILLLNEPSSYQSMDHIVKLAYAHSTLANPVFPRLYRQTDWFRPFDLPPEVVRLTCEKVALPEHSAKEIIWAAWEVACLEKDGRSLFRWSTSGSARHRMFTWVRENLVLPLILMVRPRAAELSVFDDDATNGIT